MDMVDKVKHLLEAAFSNATKIEVRDPQNDGQHLECEIIDPSFAGITKIDQHRMVQKALGDTFFEIHALRIMTRVESAQDSAEQ